MITNRYKYIILYCTVYSISVIACYLDLFINNVNHTLQDFLIVFFKFLSWIVLVVGITKNMPKDIFSNYRAWFYYAIMSGVVAAIYSFKELINVIG